MGEILSQNTLYLSSKKLYNSGCFRSPRCLKEMGLRSLRLPRLPDHGAIIRPGCFRVQLSHPKARPVAEDVADRAHQAPGAREAAAQLVVDMLKWDCVIPPNIRHSHEGVRGASEGRLDVPGTDTHELGAQSPPQAPVATRRASASKGSL